MDDKNRQSNTSNVRSLYSTVISYLNIDEEYEFNNFSFKNYLGTKMMGIDKPHIKDVVGKDIYQKVKPYLDRAFSGEEQQFEFEWKQVSDETPYLFNVHYTPDIDEEGNIKGIYIISNDVTGRKQAEKEVMQQKAFLQRIIDTDPNFIFVKDRESRFVLANKAVADAYDTTVENLIGKSDADFNSNKEEVEYFHKIDLEVIDDHKEKLTLEEVITTAKGERRWLQTIKKPLADENGDVHQLLGVSSDITRRKHSESLLKESEERLQLALDATGDGVWDWNIKTGEVIFSDKWCRSLGYDPDKIDGNTKFWKQILHPDDEESTADRIKKHFDNKAETYIHENRIRKQSGEYRYNLSQGRIVEWDEERKPSRMIGTDTDISEIKGAEYALNEKLNYQASHDSLTGLINRYEFEQRVGQLLQTIKQDTTEHALCFMDLDQFKVVNDTCGHIAGDTLLYELSMILRKKVRKRDALARLGGDEFGILIEHCSLEQVQRVAKSIQKEIQDYQFSWEGHNFKLSVSIGLVSITEATQNLTTLLRDADISCYMAKNHGRNRIHVYHAEDSETIQHHGDMQWVERINQALKEDHFCLYAQVIIPLDNHDDVHYELLIRMKDDKGKIIFPNEFLPAAERYNLITKLDCWVIKQAFKLLIKNPVFLKQVNFISINLSGQSFTDETFLNFVIKQLQESGINGNKLCFEITETAAISNLDMADSFITELRQYGCRFALDDFGRGLSSFAYLKSLPVDYLKIDGMFVKDIVDDPIDYAMVKSINEIGQVMGMQTIAEFVEKDETKGMLKAMGVNHVQGFGIGKPLAFDELLDRSNNVSSIEQVGNN
jgi:diguanylate cyclase (GGDEF)-like protein/PAS domain S-box-containing protein